MNKPGTNRFVRLVCPILAAAFLFLSIGNILPAEAARPRYTVTILGQTRPICVGEEANIGITYLLNDGESETATPTISYAVTSGSVIQMGKQSGGAVSGEVYFRYIPTTPGTATMIVWINKGSGDGSGTTTIKVLDKCEYSYKLIITLYVNGLLDGIVFAYEDIFRSEGSITLNENGFAEAVGMEGYTYTLKREMRILDLQFPQQDACNVPATVWAHTGGSGTVQVIGQLGHEGGDAPGIFIIRFRYPNVESTDSFTTPCKDGPISKNMETGFVAPDLDPWIDDQYFTSSGGTRVLTIPKFEEAVKLLNQGPGTTASYMAVLTVTSDR
jgi:hypothetical protein